MVFSFFMFIQYLNSITIRLNLINGEDRRDANIHCEKSSLF
jgi:hypothetical protein